MELLSHQNFLFSQRLTLLLLLFFWLGLCRWLFLLHFFLHHRLLFRNDCRFGCESLDDDVEFRHGVVSLQQGVDLNAHVLIKSITYFRIDDLFYDFIVFQLACTEH